MKVYLKIRKSPFMVWHYYNAERLALDIKNFLERLNSDKGYVEIMGEFTLDMLEITFEKAGV